MKSRFFAKFIPEGGLRMTELGLLEMPMNILVTGAAGFIGSTLALRLLERGDRVVGLDNLNDYYDVSLKEARLARLTPATAVNEGIQRFVEWYRGYYNNDTAA
jgi:Nucleoside-diphosphate-sugar epimerases